MLTSEEYNLVKDYIEHNGIPLVDSAICRLCQNPWRKIPLQTCFSDFGEIQGGEEIWLKCNEHTTYGVIRMTEESVRKIIDFVK